MHVASSGTTMFPKVPPTMGLGLLQTKAPALASDAINAPTDTDNAAHIDSVSIRRMETLPFLAPWLDSRIGRVLAQRSSVNWLRCPETGPAAVPASAATNFRR